MPQTDPFSYVQRSFPPMVGCLSSSSVDQICQKNNLSFVELLRPFCLPDVVHHLKDPSGNDHPLEKLLICLQDVKNRPPQPTLAKKILNESVSVTSDNYKSVTVGNVTLDIPSECPWFQSWSNTFLQVQFPSDHEFTKHLLGCLLVTSSIDPPETLQLLLQSLQQMQAVTPTRLPKWFSQSIFKYYVLVHDAKDGNKAKALKFFDSLKTAYGPEHCFFLEINSQQYDSDSTIPDYWSSCVSKKNVDFDSSDHGSSPRTPSEINSISGMPNSVATETELSNKLKDSVETSQEISEPPVSVVLHPLSPETEGIPNDPLICDLSVGNEYSRIVNANVWNNVQSNPQFGLCLSNGDVENIKALIKHLVLGVLIPHAEKQIFHLSDLVSNKKGMSRSLLSATKRLFGTNKPGSPSSASLNSVIYANDAPELYYRRLGDLYFMFTNYSMAFQAYHSAKRDFGADQAWMYYAGALEMAALSSFMQGEVTKKGVDYMEEAILIYLNSCKVPQFSTRATLLSTPFLKERHMYGEAAKQLIRMASEDSDLRSALLLEQASYCFLHSSKPNMSRKYAFHMVLAGHRFSKGGQKKHALRCYKQAFQLYKGKGWSLAEDHIHFTVGKLAGHLKLLEEGSASLASLLSSGSKQTRAQQETYLKEYLQMVQQLKTENHSDGLITLSLPIIEDNSVLVLVSSNSSLVRAFEPDSPADSVRWSRMEELAMTESQGPPMIFRPTIHLFSKKTLNTNNPIVVVSESIHIQVSLFNPLQTPLPLFRVQLLWKFINLDGKITCNENADAVCDSLVKTHVVDCIQLEPCCVQQVTLSLVPLCSGQIDILGMFYTLTQSSASSISGTNEQESNSIEVLGKQLFAVHGPKIKNKNNAKGEAFFEKDKRLEIKIVKSAPLLKLHIETSINSDMLCGEIQEASIKLTNLGNSSLKNLFLVTNSPRLISLPSKLIEKDKKVNEPAMDDVLNESNLSSDKNNLFRVAKISLTDGTLKAGEELLMPLWIRAPEKKGFSKIDLLFYYENVEREPGLGHRVSRCSFYMNVHPSVQYSASASRSTLSGNQDAMNIIVTVQNLNDISDTILTEVSLTQISLASTEWELIEKAIFSSEMKLKSQERYYFLIKALRTSNNNKAATDVCFSDTTQPSGSEQPYFDFYTWDSYTEKSQDNSLDLFTLPLFLRWNAKVISSNVKPKVVVGQSLVTLSQLNVTQTWPVQPVNKHLQTEAGEPLKIFGPERPVKLSRRRLKSVHLENALAYNLLHEHNVKHSFHQSRICCVSMKLMVRNCVDFPVRVVINSPDSKYSRPIHSKTQLYTPHSSSTFSWTSRSNAFLKLKAHEQADVPLSAAFSAPGTYDLGSRLSVAAAAEGDGDFVDQVCRVQSIIIIVMGNSSDHS